MYQKEPVVKTGSHRGGEGAGIEWVFWIWKRQENGTWGKTTAQRYDGRNGGDQGVIFLKEEKYAACRASNYNTRRRAYLEL